MHFDKIWIVLVILAVVLLIFISMLSSLRSSKGDMFKNYRDAADPWKKEDEGLRELSQRVRDLKAPPGDDHKS